jgi:hypothetical protein
MAVLGKIAQYARGELPLTWVALENDPNYGDLFIQHKVDSCILKLFNTPVTPTAQDAFDARVLDYAGKCVALDLITPGIDYWSKQPLSFGATGRNEVKAYADRAAALRALRTDLLVQTREMWPEVSSLLTSARVNRIPNVPRVRDIAVAHTPNPYDFEPAFGTVAGGTTTGGGA